MTHMLKQAPHENCLLYHVISCYIHILHGDEAPFSPALKDSAQ